MANEPRKPMSWKNPAAGGKGPAASHKREWHPTTPTAKPTGRRRRSILWPALAGAILIGLIVAAIWLLQPAKLPRLVVVGPANVKTLALSHNVAGFNAAKTIAAWSKESKDHPRAVQDPADAVVGDAWTIGIDDGKENSVVLYLSLHGGVDAQGPFLWLVPPVADVAAEQHKLRVAAVIERLAQLGDKKHKLLILDATQVAASYAHGQLHNDFVRALKTLELQIRNVPKLVVLCSSDEDQRSWVSEEWQQSIFAHLLIEGAKGAAGEDRVTVDVLFDYLQRTVPLWVASNRGEVQKPILLPSGQDGIARAKEIEFSNVSVRKFRNATKPTPPGDAFKVPSELANAWQRRDDELAKNVPPPEAVAPYHWRVHLDGLIRAEQAHRAGASPGEVDELLGRIRSAEGRLARNPWPELSSTDNALAMPAALGTRARSTMDASAFLALWADPVKGWPNLEQTTREQGQSAVARLKHDVCVQLLEYLNRQDRPDELKKAASLLQIVFGVSPAPSEVHLIRILARDLDTPAPAWSLVKQALQIHRLAEHVALTGGAGDDEFPAIELVYPWIADAVTRADVERLRGLDLLISHDGGDWVKAGQRLASAKAAYEDIAARAKQVRDAIATRNAAFAELPYYGRWVAGLRDEFPDPEESNKQLERFEKIADTAHKLSSSLEEANPEKLAEATVAAGFIRRELAVLRTAFQRVIKDLGPEVTHWHRIDNALQVPFIPYKRRVDLLKNLRVASRQLNSADDSNTKIGESRSKLKPLDIAKRHGRVAVALLGAPLVNDSEARQASGGTIKYKFDGLRQSIESPKGNWWESMNEAGDEIGRHWRNAALRADALGEKAAVASLEDALKHLARADTLARMADSATALDKTRDPVVDHRRRLLHDFLLAQARRSIDANWAAADLKATETFAEVTAARFVNDAQSLVLLGDERKSADDEKRLLAAVDPVRAALKISRIEVQPANITKSVTDQQRRLRVEFDLRRAKGQSAGYPVLRYRAEGSARAPLGGRGVLDFVGSDKPSDNIPRNLDIEIDPTANAAQAGLVTAELWHRGHHVEGRYRIDRSGNPTSMWVYNPPKGDGAIAVKAAPDMRAGAVAILLDWSFSMKPPNGPNKYDQALGALDKVLASLPSGTVVSLAQFGDPAANDPTRQVVFGPEARDFKNNPGQLRAWMKQLGENQPRGVQSPLARSIVEAAARGLPANYPGFKSIIVLTDGEDNVAGRAAGSIVKDALGTSDIAVKICFFQVDNPTQETIARAQFAPILDMETPGEFYSAANQNELIARLTDAMLPRVRVYKPDGSLVPRLTRQNTRGLQVSLVGNNLGIWSLGLEPATYQLRTFNSKKTVMVLAPGDRLLMELFHNGSQLDFRPRLYVPDVIDRNLRALSADGQKIHAGLIDCRLADNGGQGTGYDLELLMLMERERKPEEMQVTRPQFTWIDIKTQEDRPGAEPLRWHLENVHEYPTPAYRLKVSSWPAIPGQDSPRQYACKLDVSIWWRDSLPKQPYLIRRDVRKTLAENFEGEKNAFTLDQRRIEIDSVQMEGNYLLVQLNHPPGPPVVFVRPEELMQDPRLTMSEEHRFYDKTGKYHARFGPLSEEDKKRAFTLAFYAMSDMKHNASNIELRPTFSPNMNSPLGEDVKRPIKVD